MAILKEPTITGLFERARAGVHIDGGGVGKGEHANDIIPYPTVRSVIAHASLCRLLQVCDKIGTLLQSVQMSQRQFLF